jgi:TfoX/Sxy family transcriptional regulator of competence genes
LASTGGTGAARPLRRQFGDYHLTRNNVIIDGFSDLEAWGRAEGVLAGWEYVW